MNLAVFCPGFNETEAVCIRSFFVDYPDLWLLEVEPLTAFLL